MESALLRTEKAIAKNGEEKKTEDPLHRNILFKKHLKQSKRDAKETLLTAVDGDNQRMMLSALRKLTRSTPYNIIAKKSEASDKCN